MPEPIPPLNRADEASIPSPKPAASAIASNGATINSVSSVVASYVWICPPGFFSRFPAASPRLPLRCLPLSRAGLRSGKSGGAGRACSGGGHGARGAQCGGQQGPRAQAASSGNDNRARRQGTTSGHAGSGGSGRGARWAWHEGRQGSTIAAGGLWAGTRKLELWPREECDLGEGDIVRRRDRLCH
ncbi:hypothetical protein BRADI_2g25843v3 [Brachypodium distachyon]|uniref:Uncharacterized protein n=1 Tax=Brachypodium distachyon TaxID=15368 RepID=A0A0Q3MQ19_BRADI|nr:hypothetical protein BRADI_2g25843v3 [Brachypodium distachyon]